MAERIPGPLIPEKFVDVPSQRLYCLSFGILSQVSPLSCTAGRVMNKVLPRLYWSYIRAFCSYRFVLLQFRTLMSIRFIGHQAIRFYPVLAIQGQCPN